MTISRQTVLFIISGVLLLLAWLVGGDVLTPGEALINFRSLLVLAAAFFVFAHV